MRHGLLCIATVAMLFCAGTARAADTLIYSFDALTTGGTDGFGPNGGGTYTQDTIGTTVGTNSLKAVIPGGATFVGAITGTLPAVVNNPPGVDYVRFDMTVGQGQEFTGAFSLVGVTIWGCTQGGACGNQVQFSDFEHIDGKAAGTYNNVQIDLSSAANYLPGQSFNQIFGLSGSGSPLIPTHFQFFFNKSNDAPSTVYIDNVRVGGVPEPATCVLMGLGAVGLATIGRRRSR
jgi:PEP-CTERM motif